MNKFSTFGLLLLTIVSYSQTFSDSNKKTLISILPKDKGFTYSVSGTSAELLFALKTFEESNYILKSDREAYNKNPNDELVTSKDASKFFISASIVDVNKSYNEFFSRFNQPKAELSISYAVNSVTWVNWNKLSLYKNNVFKQWDFYIKLFANNTFSDYYDKVNNELTYTSDWPLFNYGLQTDFIGYNRRFWIALTGTTYDGMPTDNLKSYQDYIPTSLNTATTIVPIGKSVGKYGIELDRSQLNYRVSTAFPIFLADLKNGNSKCQKIASKMSFIPNYSIYGGFHNESYHVFGGSLGILNSGYNSSTNECIKIKPMLQFGVDWQSDPITKIWSKPNWIFSFKGTFK